jgi:hypothetical protein
VGTELEIPAPAGLEVRRFGHGERRRKPREEVAVVLAIGHALRAHEALQRIAMILTRVHATDSCVAATVPCYTAPNEDSETTTILPCGGEIGHLNRCCSTFSKLRYVRNNQEDEVHP